MSISSNGKMYGKNVRNGEQKFFLYRKIVYTVLFIGRFCYISEVCNLLVCYNVTCKLFMTAYLYETTYYS